MKKIAMILHTNGIQYDDRIRKEILTTIKLFPEINFKIFAIISGNPLIAEKGVSDYGVDYEIVLLKSRLKYRPGTKTYIKAYDFYKTLKPRLKEFDALWCADFNVCCFILFDKHPIIWDMHELPTMFLSSMYMKLLLKYMMKRCKVIIHANAERLNYLKRINAISNVENQYIVQNYPNFNEEGQIDSVYLDFIKWKGNIDCVYLQGANGISRCDKESVEAIMSIDNLKAVIVGNFDKELKERLQLLYGEAFNQKIFFTGMVPQQLTPNYMKKCKLSLVLYKNTCANNFFCEPNRMYQAIMNGCPVVVGNNPPMKNLVEKYNFGVVLDNDGSDVKSIIGGLKNVLNNYSFYYDSVSKNKDMISWNQQEAVFNAIINKIFKNI